MRKNLNQRLQAYNFWLLVLLLCSCTAVKFTKTMPSQPKAEYYSFSKFNNVQTSILDTSVIYVFANDLVRTYQSGKVEKVFTYVFLLFKSNGIALFSNDSKEAFNQANIYLVGGQYCFYKIEGNELQLEMFDHNLRKFTIMYATLLPDRVQFYKDKLRVPAGGKSKLDMPFMKSSIKYSGPLIWPQ